MSASLAVQRMVYAVLADLPGVTGVYDGVPVDATAPYLTIGPDLVTDWSNKSAVGHEHRVQVNIWDDRTSTDPVKTLGGIVEDRLRALSGSRDGHRIVGSVFLRSFVAAAPDDWTQGVVEFRIRTQHL